VYLKPMHENPELSWFETTGKMGTEASTPRRSVAASALETIRGWMRRSHARQP
jgi:hypothetical protein